MSLVGEYDLNRFAYLLGSSNMSIIVNARIKVDSATGSLWVEDPTFPGFGYQIELGEALELGNYISLRTNSLALSFDNLKVTQLR